MDADDAMDGSSAARTAISDPVPPATTSATATATVAPAVAASAAVTGVVAAKPPTPKSRRRSPHPPPKRRKSPRLESLEEAVKAAADALAVDSAVPATRAVETPQSPPSAAGGAKQPITPITAPRARTASTPSTPSGSARRSPRIAAVIADGPTLSQVLQREAAERSAVAKTIPGRTSSVRTRKVSDIVRGKNGVSGSPHAKHDTTAADGDGAGEENDQEDDDEDEEQDDDADEDADEDADDAADDDGEEGEVDMDEDGYDENASEASAAAGASTDMGDGPNMERTGTVQVSHHRVPVPAPAPTHANWKTWMTYLKQYAVATHQVIVVKGTLSCGGKNRKLAELVNKQAPVPLGLSPFLRNYICTHGWPVKNRGTGRRPKRFVHGIKCPFHFRVQWEQVEAKWILVVHNGCMWHNHRLDQETYATYPVARSPPAPENLARAKEMDDWGVPRFKIYDMLINRGEDVFNSDVNNIVSDHRVGVASVDDNEATAKVLLDFSVTNDGGLVTIDQTERGETGVVSISTRHMREMFDRFGELLLVDCTHKTNRNNYQLCTFMVMDEFGHGQVVQQSLFERNADWHMEKALDHLIEANETAWRLIRVIMVDKDLNEIRVLQARFPEVRILVCTFHVIKYLNTAALKVEYGKLSKDDHDTLSALISNLVYSKSAGVYEGNKFALETFCQKAGFMAFFAYFLKNWDSCTDMWVMYQRARLPHFKNNTNNRLENWFGKFKGGVDENSTMAECVTELLNGARRNARQHAFDNRLGRSWNANYDEEMNNILLCSTHYVADQAFPQYASALEKSSKYVYEYPYGDGGQCVAVKGQSNTHETLHGLPQVDGAGAIIPLQQIDVRWQRATAAIRPLPRFHVRDARGNARTAEAESRSTNPVPSNPVPPSTTSRERFNEARRIIDPICSELADIENAGEFKKYCDFLLEGWRAIRQRTGAAGVFGSSPTGVFSSTPVPQHGVPIELSQPHSLWSSDLGNVDVCDPAAVSMERPTPMVVDKTSHGPNMAGHGQSVDADFDMDGDVTMGSESPAAQAEATENAEESKADDADGEDGEETKGERIYTDEVPIKWNTKAPKHGAPKVEPKKQDAAASVTRIQFNESERAARDRGVTTLEGLLDQLLETKPNLLETLRALKSVPERHSKHHSKRPKRAQEPNPVLTTSDFFLLPKKLVKSSLKQLHPETIQVDTPTGITPPPAGAKKGIEVVKINQVGVFSASQIRVMDRVITLRDACLEGELFWEWLDDVLVRAVPLSQVSLLTELAARVKESFPHAVIPGVADSHVAMVYNVRPRNWFCGGLIRKFAARLEAHYKYVRYAGVFNEKGTAQALTSRVEGLLLEDGVEYVAIVINTANVHWATLILDVGAKTIDAYDSLGVGIGLVGLGWELAHNLAELGKYSVTSVNTPKSRETDSAVVFLCASRYGSVSIPLSLGS